ncbi:AAA family ATPase [Aliarcobacter butzleri]|uniref:AAA family ATPase n=1 Tax=Aliarcobacter butzleri TaxID=28197 RepID=UPI00126100C0|nr:SMC family ATPase [Aliarcobacter butzleri]
MILNNLELINFKKYTQKNLTFHEGLVGIIGKNGSGKSTIFEAILFALYGELKTKGSKDLIRNSSVSEKEPVSVTLEFEFDGLTYKVVREFRGKALTANAKFYKNEELITTGAKEVTNSIVKLVKMSKDAFMHTLFASQKELTSLSNLKPEDRKKMIRKLLGLEKIDAIESMLIEKSRSLKREIDAFREVLLSSDEIIAKGNAIKAHNENKTLINSNLTIKSKELESLKLKEIETKKELDLLQKTKEHKTKLLSELELIKNSLESNKFQQTKLASELLELQQKQKELVVLESVRIEFEQLQLKLKEQQQLKEVQLKKDGLNKEQIQLREQYTKAKNDIATLELEVKDYANLQLKQQQIQAEMTKLQTSIKEQEAQIKAISLSISGEQKLIDITKAQIVQIQDIGKGSNCPTCTRPLLEEYDKVIANLSSTIESIQKEKIDKQTLELLKIESSKVTLDKQKEELQNQLQELNKQLTIIETKQKDLLKANGYFKEVETKGIQNKKELEELSRYFYDEKIHQDLIVKEQTLKPKYDEYKKLQTLVQRVPVLQKELDEIKKAIDEKIQAFTNKEVEIKTVVYDENIHKIKIDKFTILQKQKDDLTTIINDYKVQIASIGGEIKTLQAALDTNKEHQSKLSIKQQDLSDYEKIKISLSEFKTKLNSKVAPRISQIASSMYSQITKGKYQYIEVDNDFDFYIYDEGQKFPIDRFSGGEVDLANLVLRIAISKTLGELSGAGNIGFLAFDEVFGSQDESRRMEILEAFHTIKEQYRQIFLISHEMEIKEMFERVVEI